MSRNENAVEKLKNRLLAERSERDTLIPDAVANGTIIDRRKVEGCPVFCLMPERPKGNIFYLYGSDRVRAISEKEWSFILEVSRLTEMSVTVPLYPLAPEHGCKEVFSMLIPAYQSFCRRREAGPLVIMGNGAGAGLALSLQLMAWQEGLQEPDKLVLLSPQPDTEFFDEKIEKKCDETGQKLLGKQLSARKRRKIREWQSLRKTFLDRYWVKDYAGRTLYTSPIYEDLTDICKDLLIISGTDDADNPYARRLSEKAQDAGVPVRFFEYRDVPGDFFLYPGRQESKHMMKVLQDLILDRDTAILHSYMEEVRARADWSKWFPEIFRDEQAIRYVSGHPRAAVRQTKGKSIVNLVEAATQRAYDDAVRLFLMEYPNGTVVYIGCGLDTMPDRLDNGRALWFDLDSPGRLSVRSLYTGYREREKRIDRSINDLSWISTLSVEMDKGLLFVIKNTFTYMKREEMKEFLNQLYRNFQGCNVIFDASTPLTNRMLNSAMRKYGSEYRRRRLSMRDPRREIELMNPVYSVVSVESVLENVHQEKDWRPLLRLQFLANQKKEGRKLVHIRLGYERYITFGEHFFEMKDVSS